MSDLNYKHHSINNKYTCIAVNKDTQNTSVSIVRVTSPTPSITDEIEHEEQEKKLKMEKEKSENMDDDIEDVARESDTELDKDDAPHVSLTVENFYPPEEARKFAAELISKDQVEIYLFEFHIKYKFK